MVAIARNISTEHHISTFCLVGINYKKTDASVRGKYAVSEQQYTGILQAGKQAGIDNLMVLSTCNRTEVYGFTCNTNQVADLLCKFTSGNKEEFLALAYIKNGVDAIDHLMRVATGLDSQILGDYEIISQLRQSVKFARSRSMVDAGFDRIINTALNTAKKVRTHTRLSHGTISVSFAAVQSIRQHFPQLTDLNVLLVGLGKIGTNTFKNLHDYLPTANITLINRSQEKARKLVGDDNVVVRPFCELQPEIAKADVVLVATSAAEPIICKQDVEELSGFRLFIDLSIPFNIDPAIGNLTHAKLVNVDDIAELNNQALDSRKKEVPKAQAIINEQLKELVEWHDMRKHISYINLMKEQMEHISKMYGENADASKCPYHDLHHMINNMMVKLKLNKNHGCIYLETMHSFISTELN